MTSRMTGMLRRAAVGAAQRMSAVRESAVRRRLLRSTGEVVRVRFVYAPERDGAPDPGEVVWTWVPFEEDQSQGKDRPVVVIGILEGEHVGVPLTSQPRRGRFQLGRGAWDGFSHVSFAKVDQLVRIGGGEMRREGCALDPSRFRQLVEELRRRHGLD